MPQLSCSQWAQQCWQTIGSDVVMWHFRHSPKTGEGRIWRKGTLSHKTESRLCVLHTLTDFCWQHRTATRTWFWAHYAQYLVTSIRADDNIYWQWRCFSLWLFKFNIQTYYTFIMCIWCICFWVRLCVWLPHYHIC